MNNQEIINHVRNDTRTPEEIFVSLTARIKARSSQKLTDAQAADAAKRLIKYFELYVDKSNFAKSDTR